MADAIGYNKAIAAGSSGAFMIILVWTLGLFHLTVPPEVAAAFQTLLTTACVYFVPHSNQGA